MVRAQASWIRVQASEVEFGYCYFNVIIQHDGIYTHAHFYNDADVWKDFGSRLQKFPQTITAQEEFYVEMDMKFGLKALCYDYQGHTAIQVFIDNRDIIPGPYRLEFAIPAEAASINRLGRILTGWSVEDSSEILWQAQTS